MALSSYTTLRLVDALTSQAAATDFISSVTGRHAPLSDTQKRIVITLTDSKSGTPLNAGPSASELIASIASGAALSLETKRRILIGLADAQAGNELINFVQSAATPAIKL